MQQHRRSRASEASEIEADTIGWRGEQPGALGGKQEEPSSSGRDGLNFLEQGFCRVILRADEAGPAFLELLILHVSSEF